MSESIDLDAIQARADKATPGPWKLWAMSVLADPVGDSNLDTAIPVADTFFRNADGRPRTNDATFIAHARTDVPALLAEVERLARIVNGYDRNPAEQRAAELIGHATTLNRLCWRMAVALGEIQPGQTSAVGDPDKLLDRVLSRLAEIVDN